MGHVSTPPDPYPAAQPDPAASPTPTSPAPSAPQPPAPEAPAAADGAPPPTLPSQRRATTTLGAGPRDMVISMLILLPIIGVLAFLGRGCSFSPGGPTAESSAMPAVEAPAALAAAAHQVSFPLREPAVPGNWRANAVDQRKAPGDADAVRVGWITPGGRYLRLVQTTADEGALVAAETNGPPTSAKPVAAAGLTWVDYTCANGEQAWAYRAGGVQWLITGDGLVGEFQILAAAQEKASPLPTNG
jgi:Protein of unknown function (DUF4245)